MSSLATDDSNDCACCPVALELAVFCSASVHKDCCFSSSGALDIFVKSNIEVARQKNVPMDVFTIDKETVKL